MNLVKKYTVGEEYVNAISHGVGALMGGVVCAYFLKLGYANGSPLIIFSLWLYLFGVVSSYLTSTLYHAYSSECQVIKKTLRQFDHAAIYWHIAGSYSPITLIAMLSAGYNIWGWVIFCFVWLCAIVGTSLSLYSLKKHSILETVCYVLMGLTIVVAMKQFYNAVPLAVFLWVVGEGVAYIAGAVLYSLHKVKYIHTVFHFFVLLGTVCHMIAVWYLIK